MKTVTEQKIEKLSTYLGLIAILGAVSLLTVTAFALGMPGAA